MLNKQQVTAIKSLLNTYRALLTPMSPVHDYKSLKNQVIMTELSDAIDTFTNMLRKHDDFEQEFRVLCMDRAKQNNDTCLSFSDLPNGPCNELYWNLAKIIFKPKSLQEMLTILLPEVEYYIEPKFAPADLDKKFSPKNIAIKLNQVKLKDSRHFSEPPESSTRLGELVILGNTIVDLRDLSLFEFSHHQAYFNAIKAYPDLEKRVYQHNFAFRTLLSQLQLLSGFGQTPKEALTSLIRELNLGGERISGGFFASPAAQRAFSYFLEYLDALETESEKVNNLPSDKKRVLSLTDETGKSLETILNNIKKFGCIEEAAGFMQRISDNPKNQATLMKYPTLPEEFVLKIKNFYKKVHAFEPDEIEKEQALPLESDGGSLGIPQVFMERAQNTITIDNAQDYFSLLLNFPLHYYSFLVKKSLQTLPLPLPSSLAMLVNARIFTETQRKAFLDALLENKELFTLNSLINFYIDVNEGAALIELLNSLGREDARKVVDENDLLHKAASKPNSLKEILSLYSKEEQSEKIREKGTLNQTVLHIAAKNSVSASIVLNLYDHEERVMAIQQSDITGATVLHYAANHSAVLPILLDVFPDDMSRREAILKKDMNDSTTLHNAAGSHQSLALLLSFLLTDEERRQAILQRNVDDENVFYLAASNPDSLSLILALFSPEAQQQLILKETEYESNIFIPAVENPKALSLLLGLLPTDDQRRNAVTKKNSRGFTALYLAVDIPDSLRHIFKLFEGVEHHSTLWSLIKKRNPLGETLLQKAVDNSISTGIILDALSEAERWELARTTDMVGQTVLHSAAENPASLEAILVRFTQDKQTQLIQLQDKDEDTVLHSVIEHRASLRVILECLQQKDLVSSLLQENAYNDTVFVMAIDYPESLQTILSLCSADTLFELLNKAGPTLLTSDSTNPESLSIILEKLPIEKRLLILEQKDERGVGIINKFEDPESRALAVSYLLEDNCRLIIKNLSENAKDDEFIMELSSILSQSNTDAKFPRLALHEMAKDHLEHSFSFFSQKKVRLDEYVEVIYQILADENFLTDNEYLKLLRINLEHIAKKYHDTVSYGHK